MEGELLLLQFKVAWRVRARAVAGGTLRFVGEEDFRRVLTELDGRWRRVGKLRWWRLTAGLGRGDRVYGVDYFVGDPGHLAGS